jgi:maltose-6'-phosphate glucosidase
MFKPPFILSIAGGGSTYTPGIVKSLMVQLQDFPLAEIRLYDIDAARQDTIAPVVEKVIRDHSQSIKFTVTDNPEVAFSGAHFVFAQMRVGQYKMREHDEKIPLRHGVVGQETCGPGGLAYGLRTILPMVELIDLVERYAHQKAWIVNYSNPAAIVAEGVRRLRPNARVLNICDMPVAAMRNMGAILGVDRHKLEVDYFGLNHFGWFTRVLVDGVDRLPELRRHIAKYGLLTEDAAKTDPQHSDPSWVKTWRNIKPIMDNFPEYLPNPYLQYYLMPNQIVEHQNPDYTRANEVMNGREKKLFAAAEEYKRTGILSDAFHVGVHGEFIVDVARSLAFNLRQRHLVMVENRGAITNLPYDAVVEVPAYITSEGPEPIRVGQVPLFHQTLLQQQLASEQLLVEATIEGSYEKALQAFTLNRTVPTMEHAKAILDEMIEANRDYWPALQKAWQDGEAVKK